MRVLPTSLTAAGVALALAAPLGAHVTETAELSASDGQAGDYLGRSVSVHRHLVLAGAPGHDAVASDAGAAYVFERTGLETFVESTKLLAPDGAVDDAFGEAVAISFTTAVVAAPGDDDGGADSGSVYVFVESGGSWSFQAKLTAASGAPGDLFGQSVAIEGDRILVGAPGRNSGAGAAFVFERSGTSWSQTDELTGADTNAGDAFGFSVAIAGSDLTTVAPVDGRIIVGAPHDSDVVADGGSAYLFDDLGGTWTEIVKFTDGNAVAGDEFGTSVDVLGDRALVGSPFDDDLTTDAGSFFTFEDAGGWTQIQHLTGTSGNPDRLLGHSVAISDRVLAGAGPQDEDLGSLDAGLLWVMFPQQAFFTDVYGRHNPEVGSNFGVSISASECWIATGADLHDGTNGVDSGEVYMSLAIHHFDTYCTAGTSGGGCTPIIGAFGHPSATGSSGFTLFAALIDGQRTGLFFFGTNGRQSAPWGNGSSFQCVVPPVKRTPVMSTGGTAGSCNGFPQLDLSAVWCPTCPQSGKNPGAGAVVSAQFWFRDPVNTSNQTTSLTNAIEFQVCP